MIYFAAAVPAEVVTVRSVDSALFGSMVEDIYCNRWFPAFKKSKILQMNKEFQSQLYINARNNFKGVSHPCVPAGSFSNVNKPNVTIPPSSIPTNLNSPQSSGKPGSYIPSSSSVWGGTFK